MRIDDRQLGDSQPAQAGKTNPAQAAGRQQETRSTGANSWVSSDQVQLSSLLERLANSLRSADRERAGRVEQIASEYASGSYRVDSKEVSRAIIAEARVSGR